MHVAVIATMHVDTHDCVAEMAQVRSIQVQVLSRKYKYIGLPLAMQMKLNKIHESWLS